MSRIRVKLNVSRRFLNLNFTFSGFSLLCFMFGSRDPTFKLSFNLDRGKDSLHLAIILL